MGFKAKKHLGLNGSSCIQRMVNSLHVSVFFLAQASDIEYLLGGNRFAILSKHVEVGIDPESLTLQ